MQHSVSLAACEIIIIFSLMKRAFKIFVGGAHPKELSLLAGEWK